MAKNPHAVALGKRGGSVTSARKARASRENGKKGGRPPKENYMDSRQCQASRCRRVARWHLWLANGEGGINLCTSHRHETLRRADLKCEAIEGGRPPKKEKQ